MMAQSITTEVLTDQERLQNFNSLTHLVETYAPHFSALIDRMKNDRVCSDGFSDKQVNYFGLFNAPVAKGVHHAYCGGLIAHYLEMWNYWKLIKPTIPESEEKDSHLSDERILVGIIMHDLHKCWCSYIADEKVPSGINYGQHPTDQLMTPNQKSLCIAQRFGINLDVEQLNALNNSEGGYAKSPPRCQSVLSKVLYILDELSSNVLARSMTGNWFDIRNTGSPTEESLDPTHCEYLPKGDSDV